MPMTPFYTRFRDLAFAEIRTIFVQGDENIPDGPYGFLELYCDERNCDCRRVIIQVVSPAMVGKVWATISYGWESPGFYMKTVHDEDYAKECARPSLDPLNVQTKCSPTFLKIFGLAVEDPKYVERLKRHYDMFKSAIRAETGREGRGRMTTRRRRRRR